MASKRDELLLKIRQELDNCTRPLFFFDDDPDGLSSFLQLYRYKEAGKGVVVKIHPVLDEKFLRAVKDYGPDKIFILDIPKVSESFLQKLNLPIVYIDHHNIFEHKQDNLIYFNPHVFDAKDERCVSYWCHKIVNQKDDLWIAMVGCVGDWFLPEFKNEFAEKYPDLLDAKVNKPEDALFGSKLGKLIRIFSFILKGQHKDVVASIKVLTRIKSPHEILNQETSQGRFVYKRFVAINKYYEELINSIGEKNINGNVLEFMYTEKQWSFTSDLSNELLYKFPDKVIMVCREKSGEFKCSLRSSKFKLPKRINEALEGLTGYGGGHDYACGACVKVSDFKEFLSRFKKSLS
ncbi:DHH family phosphoesterase [Candidatus Woesearchaeota archaeon]|jgi:single-stranded DNA-specific DHH superfamily exonuclease|nr:DHH family phosphoesterase [Candidatus Woesearchaeota archaeon]MBT5271766.1 DHH family phosphoesterase [Candidatus Woesearchaeota archaeon]MBT6041193.1 DHH family phosphoesterase [Candidatus Woesearchaeota archaeon]MBT6336314.1 DHH family phosphoesterase [Candidatus Woesearchaeota archaeon]MBT7927300.1 DHH family phosphoesterase [Candidatus Woesearchaeota archaeon]